MNIAFIIKAMSNQGGGAERVLADVANELVARGHQITIISNDKSTQKSYYPLNDLITKRYIATGDVTGSSNIVDFFKRIVLFRREIKAIKPDVVVAFMSSSFIPTGISLFGTGIPMVASEHIGPEHYRSRYIQWLLIQTLPLLAKKITVVSNQIMQSFNWWMRRKMVVISNPVSFTQSYKKNNQVSAGLHLKKLLSVGRFAPQKNQVCLIEAFGKIANEYPNWILRIAGDGELRPSLEAKIEELKLSERVELPGNIVDIASEYESADLFVLPSTYESFGLATAEAIMHGLPVIGFADCPGTNELIRNNENGLLVGGGNKVDALATALSSLMGDPEKLQQLQNAPTQWIQDKYSLTVIINEWEHLLQKCALIDIVAISNKK